MKNSQSDLRGRLSWQLTRNLSLLGALALALSGCLETKSPTSAKNENLPISGNANDISTAERNALRSDNLSYAQLASAEKQQALGAQTSRYQADRNVEVEKYRSDQSAKSMYEQEQSRLAVAKEETNRAVTSEMIRGGTALLSTGLGAYMASSSERDKTVTQKEIAKMGYEANLLQYKAAKEERLADRDEAKAERRLVNDASSRRDMVGEALEMVNDERAKLKTDKANLTALQTIQNNPGSRFTGDMVQKAQEAREYLGIGPTDRISEEDFRHVRAEIDSQDEVLSKWSKTLRADSSNIMSAANQGDSQALADTVSKSIQDVNGAQSSIDRWNQRRGRNSPELPDPAPYTPPEPQPGTGQQCTSVSLLDDGAWGPEGDCYKQVVEEARSLVDEAKNLYDSIPTLREGETLNDDENVGLLQHRIERSQQEIQKLADAAKSQNNPNLALTAEILRAKFNEVQAKLNKATKSGGSGAAGPNGEVGKKGSAGEPTASIPAETSVATAQDPVGDFEAIQEYISNSSTTTSTSVSTSGTSTQITMRLNPGYTSGSAQNQSPTQRSETVVIVKPDETPGSLPTDDFLGQDKYL